MHTVVEMPGYLSQARKLGLTESELDDIKTVVAGDPEAGVRVKGSGGCRKVRIAGRGKGKSGGYRVITVYASQDKPVFLLDILSKGARENFSAAEIAALSKVVKVLL